jgi:hypothetical protein
MTPVSIDFYRVGPIIRADMQTTVNAMKHNFVPVVRTVPTATIVAVLLHVRTRTMENATCRNIAQQAVTQPTAKVKVHLAAAARRTRIRAPVVPDHVLATAATLSTRQALPVWPATAHQVIVADMPTMVRVGWGDAVILQDLPRLSCGRVVFLRASALAKWQHRPWLGSCNEPSSPYVCDCGTDSSDCNSKLQHFFDTTVSTPYPHLFGAVEVHYSDDICENPGATVDSMLCDTADGWLYHLKSIVQQCCIGFRNSHYEVYYDWSSGWTPNCAEGRRAEMTCSPDCAYSISHYKYNCGGFPPVGYFYNQAEEDDATGIVNDIYTFAEKCEGPSSLRQSFSYTLACFLWLCGMPRSNNDEKLSPT